MDPSAPARMPAYGTAHLAVLAVIAVVCVVAVVLGRRTRGSLAEQRLTAATGWVVLAVFVAWTAWGLLPANWDVEQSLPFHYSDAIRVATGIALVTRRAWAIALSFYWGLTLNLQSILTPDLVYQTNPPLEFAAYWFLHGVALAAPVLLVWGLGYRPTWRGYVFAFAATLGWAVVAMTVNAITGANYGYLAHAPAGASILDLLGGWPVYLVWEAVLVAAVWALMTWACVLSSRRRGAADVGASGLVARTGA